LVLVKLMAYFLGYSEQNEPKQNPFHNLLPLVLFKFSKISYQGLTYLFSDLVSEYQQYQEDAMDVDQVSISPTFYETLFYTKVFCAAFFNSIKLF